jgi:hypothetical protein
LYYSRAAEQNIFAPSLFISNYLGTNQICPVTWLQSTIEATPLSATSAELGLGLGLGLGLDSLSHSSSHALPFFSPPSFHTLAFSPAFTSVWWSISPHKPRLVVSHSTCPPFVQTPPPPARFRVPPCPAVTLPRDHTHGLNVSPTTIHRCHTSSPHGTTGNHLTPQRSADAT